MADAIAAANIRKRFSCGPAGKSFIYLERGKFLGPAEFDAMCLRSFPTLIRPSFN
jgi:hypothetical protein